MPSFDYKEQESGIFGKVLRPLIDFEAYSVVRNKWMIVENVLADTGADVSILPKDLGEALVGDLTKGELTEIKGIVPYAKLIVYIHNLKFKINSTEFELPVAIADSNDLPPILGRVKGLDLFDANFEKGKMINLK